MAGSPEMKIMIYSQDGFGLGHLRRNLNISIQIKKRCPEASILIIADSPKAPFFKLPPKCDFIKIPTIVKVDTGVWRPDRLAMGYRELLTIRSEIIKNVAISFQPDVFLVDHMPHGALGELARPLEVLRAQCPRTKIILGLRDILGAPDVIRRQWQSEGAFAAASNFYDAVLIYGCANVFDALTEYQFPEGLLGRTQYCGYVSREQDAPVFDSSALQTLLGSEPRGKFILVTGGGGADASYFMDQFIEAVRHLQPTNGDFTAVISTGPFMHKDQRRLLRQKAVGLPIIVTQMGQDSIRFLSHADLVISMAGYNTVSEIMRYRKNAIIVPRPGPSLEQTMRTRILTERGLFSSIHPNVLTAGNLAELIRQRLQDGAGMNEAMLPDLNGASRVANFVLSAL
ncbi:MAG: UDP-N-acetylglucosamine--N-acetylmuramyl-(pentapeptide) pyrophosphoryl-undecaprenol N-acetylglucosamine transferase [bacterium]|nr:UDP-N-acetylglucosamine--N-acetylmuramyl-(pentapeptide) pyrophosphoryl-undecaprenol N-acetylglucosamine transferase [bacterium]